MGAMTEPALTVWVVYDHPSDFPDHVVVRGQDIVRGQLDPVPHKNALLFASLDDARAVLQREGLTRVPRHPSDDGRIVESWV